MVDMKRVGWIELEAVRLGIRCICWRFQNWRILLLTVNSSHFLLIHMRITSHLCSLLSIPIKKEDKRQVAFAMWLCCSKQFYMLLELWVVKTEFWRQGGVECAPLFIHYATYWKIYLKWQRSLWGMVQVNQELVMWLWETHFYLWKSNKNDGQSSELDGKPVAETDHSTGCNQDAAGQEPCSLMASFHGTKRWSAGC